MIQVAAKSRTSNPNVHWAKWFRMREAEQSIQYGVACSKGSDGGLHLSCCEFDSHRLHQVQRGTQSGCCKASLQPSISSPPFLRVSVVIGNMLASKAMRSGFES